MIRFYTEKKTKQNGIFLLNQYTNEFPSGFFFLEGNVTLQM